MGNAHDRRKQRRKVDPLAEKKQTEPPTPANAPQSLQSRQRKAEPLQRSSLEAYGGIVIAIILAFPANVYVRGVLVIILCLIVLDLCFRSPVTINLGGLAKSCLSAVGVVVVLSVLGRSVWEQHKEEQERPNI